MGFELKMHLIAMITSMEWTDLRAEFGLLSSVARRKKKLLRGIEFFALNCLGKRDSFNREIALKHEHLTMNSHSTALPIAQALAYCCECLFWCKPGMVSMMFKKITHAI